jgi:hypothetical protein
MHYCCKVERLVAPVRRFYCTLKNHWLHGYRHYMTQRDKGLALTTRGTTLSALLGELVVQEQERAPQRKNDACGTVLRNRCSSKNSLRSCSAHAQVSPMQILPSQVELACTKHSVSSCRLAISSQIELALNVANPLPGASAGSCSLPSLLLDAAVQGTLPRSSVTYSGGPRFLLYVSKL